MTSPQNLDERLREAIAALSPPDRPRPADEPVRAGSALTGAQASALFDAQLTARHLDLAARWLRSFGEGYHPVPAAGHEGDAAVAAAVRDTDPAVLDGRCAGFLCARAARARPDGLVDAARDVLRGVVASAADPVTGGRHQVLGGTGLHIVPTAATLAGHLPRALGLAAALPRGGHPYPDDAIVVCFVDADGVDHATATGTLNAAGRYTHTDRALPLLLVCADAGSPSPPGWVEATLRARPGLRYAAADGCDLAATHAAAHEAAGWVREHRRPAVLHLSTVRLMGHAGRRGAADTARDVSRDPLVATADLLVRAGQGTPAELIARYDELGWQIRKLAEEVLAEPKLASGADVVAPLAPRRPLRAARAVADAAVRALGPGAAARRAAFADALPEDAGRFTLAQAIDAALTDALAGDPRILAFAPEVADHGLSRHLAERFPDRVVATGADESTAVGLALGAGLAGRLPVLELAAPTSLHAAQEQLRDQAATLSFLSNGASRNPMVLRIPGLADPDAADARPPDANALAGLRDVPGLVVAVPSGPADAAPLLRSCLAAAAVDGSVCVVLEPVALYHTRDLHEAGDDGWLAGYPAPERWPALHIPVGRASTRPVGSADDLTIVTFGNGVRLSLRVAARLAAEGYGSRVVDLRWLSPLPVADLVREAAVTGRVLVVDETRRSGGVGEGVLAALVDGGYVGAARRVAAVDSFVPLGPAARHVLVGEDAITQGAYALLTR